MREPAETASFHQENLKKKTRFLLVFALLVAALIVIIILNINSGDVHIPPGRILRIIFGGAGTVKEINIIWTIRMPRIIMAAILGGALALAGFLLQTFFENPIAGPYVLGISSGAKMVVALVLIIFSQTLSTISSYTLITAAFIGSLMSMGFILLINKRVPSMAALLVAGIMIGYICSAVTDFVITFAEDSEVSNLHGWSQGSFSGMTWDNIKIAAVIVGVIFVLVMILSKPIGAYALGEAYAQSVGVHVRRFRVALILLSSLLAACVTAFAGPISFVGIAVPFLAKRALGTSKPLVVVPCTFLFGAVFCTICDLIARRAFAPVELNISTVTSIFGAPIVIFMLLERNQLRRKRRAK